MRSFTIPIDISTRRKLPGRFLRMTAASLAMTALVLLALPSTARAEARRGPEERFRWRLEGMRVPFIANAGQTDAAVAYYAPTFAGTVFVTLDGRIVYSLPGKSAGEGGKPQRSPRASVSAGWTLTEAPVGTTGRRAQPIAQKRAQTQISYFLGNDPSAWTSGIATYEEVSLGELWPGVTVSLRARGKSVEKVFTVEPGGDSSRIRMRVSGARSLKADGTGGLIASTGPGDVRLTRPVAYQECAGTRREITVTYQVRGDSYGFDLGAYDPELPLVIDPLLQATYLGGSGGEIAQALAIDPTSGDVYVAGYSGSTAFPGTTGGAQAANGGGFDVFVARLTADLRTLTQATYLGGTGTDVAYALVIHPASGDVYVAGTTMSTNFPGTTGGAQAVYGGGGADAFVARLTADLATLTKATYLGGSSGYEGGQALAIHPISGNVYAAGFTTSTNLPGTTGGAQAASGGGSDFYVARLTADLTSLTQATYLGGSNNDSGLALAIHPSSGDVYLAGNTVSTDFPGTTGGAQAAKGAGGDAVVARLTADLTTLTQATYLGGGGNEIAYGLAIHPTSGDIYLAGYTGSTDFPGTTGGAQPASGGFDDAFIARLTPDLATLTQTTYLGGSGTDVIYAALAIDPTSGNVYAAGYTTSTNFPGTSGGAQAVKSGNADAFIARLTADLATLTQATYLGGNLQDIAWAALAIHPTSGDVYVAGETSSTNFPGTTGGAQAAEGGGVDAFVARLTADLTDGGGASAGPVALKADQAGNGVFEPGETVVVSPSWRNLTGSPIFLTGLASNFTGPSGPTYTITNNDAAYGTLAGGAWADCASATTDCYGLNLSIPASRPLHWDASFSESVSSGDAKTWTLHIGNSFTDVDVSSPHYRFIETLLHNGVTAGYGDGTYGPDDPLTRAQAAVFLLVSKEGAGYTPPPCTTPVFSDVLCSNGFAKWINELAARAATAGCSLPPAPQYCPTSPVTRGQMAVFLLRVKGGMSYTPPPCVTPTFGDVPCSSGLAPWVNELAARGITGGCSLPPNPPRYCPTADVTRGQAATFLTATFGLTLYGP